MIFFSLRNIFAEQFCFSVIYFDFSFIHLHVGCMQARERRKREEKKVYAKLYAYNFEL